MAIAHLWSWALVVGQEGCSPHARTGKAGQSNAGTLDPTALPDSPGAEALSLGGLFWACVTQRPGAGTETPLVQQRKVGRLSSGASSPLSSCEV